MARKSKKNELILTPELIQQHNDEYNKLTAITFDDGKYTHIYKTFRYSTIETCVEALADFLADYERHGGQIADDKTFSKLLYLHIVIFFSTIVPELPSDFPAKLNLIEMLADNEYVIKLDDHFDQKEIEKVYIVMFKKLDALKKLMQQNEELRNQMLAKIDTLENKDIIKNVLFNEGDTDGKTHEYEGA